MCTYRDNAMDRTGELPPDFRTAVEIEWSKKKTMDEGFSKPLENFSAAEVAPQGGAIHGYVPGASGPQPSCYFPSAMFATLDAPTPKFIIGNVEIGKEGLTVDSQTVTDAGEIYAALTRALNGGIPAALDLGGAAVRGEAVAEVLKEARAFIEANCGEVGYGFHRPTNPHEFHPDAESCSAEEITAHKAACEAYDKGEFKQDQDSGWIGPNVHLLTAPWGIGSYAYRNEEAEGMIAKIDAALSARAADAPSEPSDAVHNARLTLIRELGDEELIASVKCGKVSIHAALLKVLRGADALDSQTSSDEPTEREALIACLGDDAVTLLRANRDNEMAQTMREAAAMLYNDGQALNSQPTDG